MTKLFKTGLFSFLIIQILFSANVLLADEGFIVGATASTGVIYAKTENEHISMNREIIRFDGFMDKWISAEYKVPLSKYKVLFEFENHSDQLQEVPCAFPVNVFFTDFSAASRSNIIDNLAMLMPDIFTPAKNEKAFLDNLEEQFERRTFIRRIINTRDLAKLNLELHISHNDKPVDIQKIVLEFRLLNDEKNKDRKILFMEAHMVHKLVFQPKKVSQVIVEYVAPAFKTSYSDEYFFAPYILGTGRTWKDDIKEIYIVHKTEDAGVAFPYYMDYSVQSYGMDMNLITIKNHEPETNEKIGFYNYIKQDCDCSHNDGQPYRLTFPVALKEVGASGWLAQQETLGKACYYTNDNALTVKWVPDFELGDNHDLSFLRAPLERNSGSNKMADQAIQNNCAGQTAIVNFTEMFHPVWAFDLGPDSVGIGTDAIPGRFDLPTCWCEGKNGFGENEYLEFEITQAVSLIQFFTGNHRSTETYTAYNRVEKFELQQVDGQFKKMILLSDLVSSSYELDLAPGKYRLVLKSVFPGLVNDHSCIAGIRFRFEVDEPWLNEQFANM